MLFLMLDLSFECLIVTHERLEGNSLGWVKRERRCQLRPDTLIQLLILILNLVSSLCRDRHVK